MLECSEISSRQTLFHERGMESRELEKKCERLSGEVSHIFKDEWK